MLTISQCLKKTIATTYALPDGKFTLDAEFLQTEIALLALDLKKGEIILEPGSSYEIRILEDTSSKENSIFEQSPLRYKLLNNSSLNSHLQDFNGLYNTFLLGQF